MILRPKLQCTFQTPDSFTINTRQNAWINSLASFDDNSNHGWWWTGFNKYYCRSVRNEVRQKLSKLHNSEAVLNLLFVLDVECNQTITTAQWSGDVDER